MAFLLCKHGLGKTVGLRVSSWGEDFVLREWLVGFGKTHTVMWFDELVGPDEIKSRRKVTFGIFVWAVRCGILDEEDLCANLGRVGGLLYQLVGYAMVLVWSMLMSRRLSRVLFVLTVGACYLFLLPDGGFIVIACCD